MILHIREAKYLHDYVLWLRFNDGAEGKADLKDELSGEVFEPLQDIEQFKQFTVDRISKPWYGRTAPTWLPSFYMKK